MLSTSDICDIFRGRISTGQFAKNISRTGAALTGGTIGAKIGGVIGGTIGTMIMPGVGTKVGTTIGRGVGGAAGGTISTTSTDAALDFIVDDDTEYMLRLIEEILVVQSRLHLLGRQEVNELSNKVASYFDESILKDMFASLDRKQYVLEVILPMIAEIEKNRKTVEIPSNEEMLDAIKEILEEASDNKIFETEKRINCPQCGRNISQYSKFCSLCGFSLAESKAKPYNCRTCGNRFEPWQKYCTVCGNKLI